MQVFHGRNYENGEPIAVKVVGAKITAIEPAWPKGSIDDWPYIAPGLFDLQINGHGGNWFGYPNMSIDDMTNAIVPHIPFGITRLCPTFITNSRELLNEGFDLLRQTCESNELVNQMVPGCHLEGPYISSEDGPRGAHPLEHVRAADWDEFEEFQERSGNRIRLVTLAPEIPNAIEFIQKAVASGVVISIGHTAANSDQISAAVDAGARLSTHLGNGAHGTIRRHPNYIWDQLGDERLMASIISDGHHLPDSVTRTIVKTKTPLRTIITCDASGLVGYPPGVYDDGSMAVEIMEDGRIVLAGQDQLLAGSACETDHCVAQLIRATGVRLSEAIDMAGRNPARLLGFDSICLRRGSRADLFLFHYQKSENKFAIATTVVAGEVRFGTIPEL